MADVPVRSHSFRANFQANLIAGLLTIAPLIAVWLVFDFFLTTLSQWGHPLAAGLIDFLEASFPMVKPVLDNATVRWLLAVLTALLALYAIGAIATQMIGQRALYWIERLIARVPGVEMIYSATKKLIDVVRHKPGSAQRVVLIDFPHDGLKAIGFIMRTFPDAKTGEELAAVYVPTAPNPTSGYLQILPLARLTPTEIQGDQAMAMILSGGAVTPDHLSIAPK